MWSFLNSIIPTSHRWPQSKQQREATNLQLPSKCVQFLRSVQLWLVWHAFQHTIVCAWAVSDGLHPEVCDLNMIIKYGSSDFIRFHPISSDFMHHLPGTVPSHGAALNSHGSFACSAWDLARDLAQRICPSATNLSRVHQSPLNRLNHTKSTSNSMKTSRHFNKPP